MLTCDIFTKGKASYAEQCYHLDLKRSHLTIAFTFALLVLPNARPGREVTAEFPHDVSTDVLVFQSQTFIRHQMHQRLQQPAAFLVKSRVVKTGYNYNYCFKKAQSFPKTTGHCTF